MSFIIPTTWSQTASYTSGQQVLLDGVLYEASGTITAGTNPKTSTLWTVIAVHNIQDYNSLVEAVRLNLNVDDDEINRSVPLFIQLAEESFKTRIRAPQMRRRVILTVDASSRVEVPGDLLEVINVRHNSDSFPSLDIRSRGVIEILNANYEEYQRLLRFEESNSYVGAGDVHAFDAPVFWFDNRYFNIAPRYIMGTEIELWYYAAIPQLGTTILLTDDQGRPIDSDGMLVSVSGNPQATSTVTQNWFTAAAPQMLLYGALMKSEAYLKDAERIEMWKASFEAAQAETQDMVNRFTENQAHTLFLESTYASRI